MSATHEAIAADGVRIGRQDAEAERHADRRTRVAEQRLGLGGRPAFGASAVAAEPREQAPAPVAALARSGGAPLPAADQHRFGRAFDHDFSHVRIHSGAEARAAAGSIDAQAFTLGRHVALPDPQPGILAHELSHVVDQDRGLDEPNVVRRLSIGEWFSRLVGEGTYSDDELKNYLMTLDQTNKIEDTSESDDKARQVVAHGMHKTAFPDPNKSLRIRQLLIEEMISGFTGDDDENAILKILDDAPMPEREWLVKAVGKPVLEDNFHGDEFQKLEKLLAGLFDAKDAPVPLDWSVEYRLDGDPKAMKGAQGVLLRNLSYRPEGMAQPVAVATDEDLVLPPLTPKPLPDKPPAHPRNKGGEGSAELQVGPVDEEGLIVPATDQRKPTTPTTYGAIDPLKKQVIASLDVTVRADEIGETKTATGTRDVHATGKRDSTAKAIGHEESQEQSAEVTDEASRTDSATLDYERRLAKKRERERSKNKSETKTEEKGVEHGEHKEKGEFESETSGDEKFGQTETINGGAEFSGKMDAKLTGEIKKASESKLVTIGRWALKLGKLLPGQYGRILKILDPIGEKILDLFKPGEDDLEIEFDAEGNFELKGTFHAKSSVKGWREFRSKTKGRSSGSGTSDVTTDKKGVAKTQGSGSAVREGEEASAALKQGAGVAVGKRQSATAGTKKGSKDSQVTTSTHETFEEDRHEDFKETSVGRKDFIAVIDKATLRFKVM